MLNMKTTFINHKCIISKEIIVFRVLMYANPLLLIAQALDSTSKGQSVCILQYSGVISENN